MRTVFLLACAVLLGVAEGGAQRGGTPPAIAPLSMTCPDHPEVVQSRPGQCPICQKTLVPVRLNGAWMCPVHSAVIELERGRCRVCQRDLIRVTVALTWACRGETAAHLEPGLCADGTPRIEKRALRPHGNHNPKHGGQFFMAPDNWHHLEGTYPRDRVFRLYVYDDYARPLPADQLRQIEGRVVTRETFDAATRTTTEQASFALRPSRDGGYLEARLDPTSLPAEMTAKVRLAASAPEYRFDFTFSERTRDPSAPSTGRGTQTARSPVASPAANPAGASPVAATSGPSFGTDPAFLPLAVPNTMEEMVAQLRARRDQVRGLIDRGNLEAVYVPAFYAKDLAVALEPHVTHLQPAQREAAAPALEEVVRTAWLLDAFGDVGNRQQITDALAAFSRAVDTVTAAFSGSVMR